MIRVGIIEDFPLMLMAIQHMLEAQEGIAVVDVQRHGSEWRAMLDKHPDMEVLLLDLGMKTGVFDPVSNIQEMTRRHAGLKVVVLTSYDTPSLIREVLQAGAHGYLIKDDVETLNLVEIVESAHAGAKVFSKRVDEIIADGRVDRHLIFSPEQLAVLRMMAQGCRTNEEVADALNTSVEQVKFLVTVVYARLQVRGAFITNDEHRLQAVGKAIAWNIIPPPA